MPLSNKKSAAKFSFGTADRASQAKIYHNKDLARIDFGGSYLYYILKGKSSPGPIYDVGGTDVFFYKKVSNLF